MYNVIIYILITIQKLDLSLKITTIRIFINLNFEFLQVNEQKY